MNNTLQTIGGRIVLQWSALPSPTFECGAFVLFSSPRFSPQLQSEYIRDLRNVPAIQRHRASHVPPDRVRIWRCLALFAYALLRDRVGRQPERFRSGYDRLSNGVTHAGCSAFGALVATLASSDDIPSSIRIAIRVARSASIFINVTSPSSLTQTTR